jgi:hypothetical protein
MLLRDPVAQVLQGFDEVQGGLIPKSYESAAHLNQLQALPKLSVLRPLGIEQIQ